MASNSSPSTPSANDLAPPMNIPLPHSKVPLCAPTENSPNIEGNKTNEHDTKRKNQRTTRPSVSGTSLSTLEPYAPSTRRPQKTNSQRRQNFNDLFGEAPDFVKFYTIKSTNDADLRKLNLFKVDRAISSAIGEPARITEAHDKTLTVEVKTKVQGENLLRMKTLVQENVEVVAHQRYNQSQGVITSDILLSYSEEDIQEGLSSEGVLKVYRIRKRSNTGTLDPTATLVLTFNTSQPPERIRLRAGLMERVRPYVPLPRRCYNCQQYGHVTKNCRREQAICGRCGQPCDNNHSTTTCQRPYKCFHCQEPHSTSSRTCSKNIMEKEILALKVKEHLTFKEARHRISLLHINSNRPFASVVRSSPSQPRPGQGSTDLPPASVKSPRQTSRASPPIQVSRIPVHQSRDARTGSVQSRDARTGSARGRDRSREPRLIPTQKKPESKAVAPANPSKEPLLLRNLREAYVSPIRTTGQKRSSPTSPSPTKKVSPGAQKRSKKPNPPELDNEDVRASPMDADAWTMVTGRRVTDHPRPRSSSLCKYVSGESLQKYSPSRNKKKSHNKARERKS